MADSDTTILQSDDQWDFEAGEVQRAPRGRRSVVSVGFKPDEFRRVAEAAREHDVPLSQFIRDAAMQRAQRPYFETIRYITPNPGMIGAVAAEVTKRAASEHRGRMIAAG